MATKTYYLKAQNDFTKKLTDHTLPWEQIDSSALDTFNDIKAVAGEANKAIKAGANEKILTTNDEGATWNVPIGDYELLNTVFRKVFIVDSSVSYCIGDFGAVVKSVDGGLSFNSVTYATTTGANTPDQNARAIHFINPLVGLVCTGIDDGSNTVAIFKTTDGGVTWTNIQTLNPGSLGNFISGIRMSADEQTIILGCAGTIYRSTDGGAVFGLVYDLSTFAPFTGEFLLMTWFDTDNLWCVGAKGLIARSIDAGITWSIVNPLTPGAENYQAAHFHSANDGYIGAYGIVYSTNDGGTTLVISDDTAGVGGTEDVVTSIHTEELVQQQCFFLESCDSESYPDLPDTYGAGLDLVVGNVINVNGNCYTVIDKDISLCQLPGTSVTSFTVVGNDCASFSLSVCPVEIPLTIVGETSIIDIDVNNLSADFHTFNASFGSCIASGMTILNPNLPLNGGESGIIQIEYTPTLAEDGVCEFNVEGPCGTIECDVHYRAVSVPDCPHFNICITGPTCAPACIMPGEVISFDLGGNIAGIAYPTVVTFQVIDQVTQEVIFNEDYPITSDEDLDNLVINVIAPGPSKYCAEVCLPGCNAKRVLCFDVCEPFDIYKDSCNHWHVHKPETCCDVEEYLVSVTQFNCDTPIVDDVLWNVDQDNTFEFEVPNDGIFIFNMKDPVTGDVIYSFSAFETCALQKCFQIMMDKIMCSCADPCCKKCDGSPEEEREFSRMSLNKLVPLYMTYLGMARRNELYTVGMKLITDEQNCFLHDANQILGKINDIIMDCGCLCPGQENTASNRDGCKTC